MSYAPPPTPAPTGAEPPLDWPWYGIGFGAAIKRFFAKYATFSGRASRGEYWWIVLFNALVYVVFAVLAGVSGVMSYSASQTNSTPPAATALSAVFGLYYLAILVPSLAIAVRRLHDTGHSGWWILFGLVPLVGGIVLLVFYASATTPTAEQYGPPHSQATASYQAGQGYGGQGYPYPPS